MNRIVSLLIVGTLTVGLWAFSIALGVPVELQAYTVAGALVFFALTMLMIALVGRLIRVE